MANEKVLPLEQIAAASTPTDSARIVIHDSAGSANYIDLATLKRLVRESIQIGGRNLLKGQSEDWWQAELARFAFYISLRRTYEYFDVKAGDAVTFSLDIKNTTQKKVTIGFEPYNSDSDRRRIDSEAVLPGEEKRVSVSMILPSGFSILNLRVNNMSSEIPDAQVLTVRRAKLERGNIATDWTPAPEDFGGG